MFRIKINEALELKLLGEEDASGLYRLVDNNKEHLSKWLDWVAIVESEEDLLNYIKKIRKIYDDEEGVHAGIWYEEEIIGVIALPKIDWENKWTTMGYWLGENYEKKGITTTACEVMIDYIFKKLELHRIEIRCATENEKSKKIPEKLGFEKEGILRDTEWLNNKHVSHVVYGLLEDQWNE